MSVTIDTSEYMQAALEMLGRLQMAGQARNRATLMMGEALSDLYQPQTDGVFAWKRIAPECDTWGQFLSSQDYLPSYSSCERAKTVYEVWGGAALHLVGGEWLNVLSQYPFSRLYDTAMLIKGGVAPDYVWEHLSVGYSGKDWGVWVATEKAALALPTGAKPPATLGVYTQYTTPRNVPELEPPQSLRLEEVTGHARALPAIAAVTVAPVRTHMAMVKRIEETRGAVASCVANGQAIPVDVARGVLDLLLEMGAYLNIVPVGGHDES
jgi:hypothetical protein